MKFEELRQEVQSLSYIGSRHNMWSSVMVVSQQEPTRFFNVTFWIVDNKKKMNTKEQIEKNLFIEFTTKEKQTGNLVEQKILSLDELENINSRLGSSVSW